MLNKLLMAQRTLMLVDGYWNKYMAMDFGCTRHVFSLTAEYDKAYLYVCKKMVKSSCRLRQLFGYEFTYSVLGEKFANDILFSI